MCVSTCVFTTQQKFTRTIPYKTKTV